MSQVSLLPKTAVVVRRKTGRVNGEKQTVGKLFTPGVALQTLDDKSEFLAHEAQGRGAWKRSPLLWATAVQAPAGKGVPAC